MNFKIVSDKETIIKRIMLMLNSKNKAAHHAALVTIRENFRNAEEIVQHAEIYVHSSGVAKGQQVQILEDFFKLHYTRDISEPQIIAQQTTVNDEEEILDAIQDVISNQSRSTLDYSDLEDILDAQRDKGEMVSLLMEYSDITDIEVAEEVADLIIEELEDIL